ncbi:MAG: hypothetical protein IT508_00580 [Burkholderiaceae bacterium]|nr:hypothetical protein [Burkholderiaceae bacterium]
MNKRLETLLRALFALPLCLGLAEATAGAQAREPVGIVAEYQPVKDRYSITGPARTAPAPLTIGTQVYAGDRVELPAGGLVIVTGADGGATRITGPGTLALAPASAKGLGMVGKMLASLQGYFGEPYRASRIAASQGGEDCAGAGAIDVPLFPEGSAVVAGTRDLRFAWKGGCAPFTVVVRDARGGEIARTVTSNRAARFREIVLPAGRVAVEIATATDTKRLALDTVAARPAPPDDLATDGGANLALLAQAYWLAEQDAGRWRFESFDLLAPRIRAGDPLAGKLGDLLLWGPGGAPP